MLLHVQEQENYTDSREKSFLKAKKKDKNLSHTAQHDKPNKMTCALSEDSDQPGHPPSLIRVFAMCSLHWVADKTAAKEDCIILNYI